MHPSTIAYGRDIYCYRTCGCLNKLALFCLSQQRRSLCRDMTYLYNTWHFIPEPIYCPFFFVRLKNGMLNNFPQLLCGFCLVPAFSPLLRCCSYLRSMFRLYHHMIFSPNPLRLRAIVCRRLRLFACYVLFLGRV